MHPVDRARLSIQSKLRTIHQYSKIRKLVLVPKQSPFCSHSIRLNYMMLKCKMKRHFFSCSKFTLLNLLLSHDLNSVEANRITTRWVSITLKIGSFGPRSRPTVFATPARVASQSRGMAANISKRHRVHMLTKLRGHSSGSHSTHALVHTAPATRLAASVGARSKLLQC